MYASVESADIQTQPAESIGNTAHNSRAGFVFVFTGRGVGNIYGYGVVPLGMNGNSIFVSFGENGKAIEIYRCSQNMAVIVVGMVAAHFSAARSAGKTNFIVTEIFQHLAQQAFHAFSRLTDSGSRMDQAKGLIKPALCQMFEVSLD